jgi:[ribosomal protein S18]-alanine N-acetyltransferase
MHPEIMLREAAPQDIPAICSIENESFSTEAFSKKQFFNLLKSKNSFFIVAVIGENISGYMILMQRSRSFSLRIYSIAVHNSARNLHIGSRLIKYAEHIAHVNDKLKITLEVSVNNTSAFGFYLKNGFTLTGLIPEYYKDKSDAWKMEKKI